MSLVHPLAKVLGSGSAKSGVHHWWLQRVTAIGLVPLTLWVVWAVVAIGGAGHTAVVSWMSNPINAALLLIWVTVMLYHAQLGMQVVVEDYIHQPAMALFLHLATKFAVAVGIVVSVLSILRVALGGAA
jgi:succinate dehydrogenase / fumarate reductase membrane anchor subunit